MKTFIVTVLVHTLEHFEVEAENADEAMDVWQDGRFLGTDDAGLESELQTVRAKGRRR
jgi:hypothetical protein